MGFNVEFMDYVMSFLTISTRGEWEAHGGAIIRRASGCSLLPNPKHSTIFLIVLMQRCFTLEAFAMHDS